jgi:hypothetical protein
LTQKKSADIVLVEVVDNSILIKSRSEVLDFGVLSVQQESTNEFSVACNDGTVKLISLQFDDATLAVKVVNLYDSLTSDTCLMHSSNDNYILAGTNTGSMLLFDKTTS